MTIRNMFIIMVMIIMLHIIMNMTTMHQLIQEFFILNLMTTKGIQTNLEFNQLQTLATSGY